MPLRLALLMALGALLAFAGCGAEPERSPEPTAPVADSATVAPAPPVNPFAEPARRALRIELELDDYRRIEGTWAAGNAASTFTAYFAGDTLRFIEEQLEMGASGTRTTVYYFEEGALFYAVRDEQRARLASASAGSDTLQTRAAFGPAGQIRATQRIVNGAARSAPAVEVEVEGLREHADALRGQAIALRTRAATPAA